MTATQNPSVRKLPVSALRWWRPALRDDRPVQHWTIAIVQC